jgi:hypothetical protein
MTAPWAAFPEEYIGISNLFHTFHAGRVRRALTGKWCLATYEYNELLLLSKKFHGLNKDQQSQDISEMERIKVAPVPHPHPSTPACTPMPMCTCTRTRTAHQAAGGTATVDAFAGRP